MVDELIFLALVSFSFVAEGYHDYFNKMERTAIYCEADEEEIQSWRSKWHMWNVIFYMFFVAGFLSLQAHKVELDLTQLIAVVLFVMPARAFALNITHNLLSKNDWNYLSNHGFDKIMKNKIGNTLYFVFLLCITAFFAALIIIE